MTARDFAARARSRAAALAGVVVLGSMPVVTLAAAPAAQAADGVLSYVGAASTAGNRTAHTVRMPTQVRAGDTLVLFLTMNSVSNAPAPAGWTQIQARDGNGTRGLAWTKTAAAADSGANVTVSSAATVKSTISVGAYRSTVGQSEVTASASSVANTSATTHTTPSVPVTQTGSWLVSSWGEKSSTATTWTLPGTVTSRTTAAGTGSGKVSSVVGDSAGVVPVGTAAGRRATTSTAVGRDVLFSVVIAPGEDTGPSNATPTASFTSSCAGLSCSFDASASTDADGDPLTYSWNFGDGRTGSGVAATNTYATAGAKAVTLTVSDGTASAQATRQVTVTTPPAGPGHTRLVPGIPRTNTPLISQGEIWDFEVVGKRVYVVGGFSSARNNASGNTTSYNQAGILAFDMDTGLVDTGFRPTVNGSVDAVEASPDGTRLFLSGAFSSVNGTARQNVVRLSPTTGTVVTGFTANTDGKTNELAVTDTTVYLGGRFTRVNGVARSSLAAVSSDTGAVVTGFVNNLSGGIGVSGGLGVQRLDLSHDLTKLLVVHTGRQVNGQDRYGVALINTVDNKLLPWRTRLWEDNLQFVGGIQRVFAGDVGVGDDYFVVGSGSGGDRPPINDTVVAFPTEGGDDVKPLWVSRHFDSVYSVAAAEDAVYVGGHFAWQESPTARDPWPGLDNVGYGTGQGLSGYSLGDDVVRREHVGALDPETGKALEWNPGSNSAEGNKAMEVTSRGLVTGGDATTQGGYNVGRIAFYDFNTVAASNGVETRITDPIEGRVKTPDQPFTITGKATAASGVSRVQLEIQDRNSKRYLQDDLVTWGPANTINTTLANTGASSTDWSLPVTISGNRDLQVWARAFAANGTSDNTKDTKKFETFGVTDQPPGTNVTGPSGSVITTTTFTVTGTATDDKGVSSVSVLLKDANNRYIQDDGSASTAYNTFRVTPDVVGATSTTWSREFTVPHEGEWMVMATATDNAGNSDLDSADRSWIVSSTGIAPSVSVTEPASMVPPTATAPLTVAPGSPMRFSGNAVDDEGLGLVEITLRNTTTREVLAADGSWGTDVVSGSYRVSPQNVSGASYSWSYTTPFNLRPGSYSFTVRATDDIGLTTSSTNQGRLTVNVQVPGDAPPDGRLDFTGTDSTKQTLDLNLTGTATDDNGVAAVKVALVENSSGRYVQPGGTLAAAFATLDANLATPRGTSTTWSLPVQLPSQGDYSVTAYAFDTADQQDTSTSGATARYRVYPGDTPPVVLQNLLAPTEGTAFTQSKIFVSGRVEDDQAIASAQVAILDSAGRYMSSGGTFTSTAESWRSAFLNSPGSLGSNYSYTTPAIPAGTYQVRVRGTDQHGFTTNPTTDVTVTVTAPPDNQPPVASFTSSCEQNVCAFDGRGSTDENAPQLGYAWTFGTSSSTGALVTRTFTSPGTVNVTLTVKDEYGATASTTGTVTIAEPPGNVAPAPVINLPSCVGLVCNISGVGSTDPNVGDTVSYLWDFGDGTPTSTSSAMSHAFAAAGNYVLTLTVTDGWGKSATTTRTVAVSAGP